MTPAMGKQSEGKPPGPDPAMLKILALAGNPPPELKAALNKAGDRVAALRPGYGLESGHPVPSLIVLTSGVQAVSVPATVDGIPVRVQPADLDEQRLGTGVLASWRKIIAPSASVEERAAPSIGYTPPETPLAECEVNHILCHIGPDSGWQTLEPFLKGTESTLTVSMYDFYAPQIIDTMVEMGSGSRDFEMVLQVDKPEERTAVGELKDAWGERFKFTPAVVSGPHRIFANSYHTKVAVRDSKAFWLSSGNWSPHSQPVVPDGPQPTAYRLGNREWHVIIGDETLAAIFETYIKHDFEQAAAASSEESAEVMPDLFVPLSAMVEEAAAVQPGRFDAQEFAATGTRIKVQPLMTPDNYSDFIIPLINSAQETLWMQYAYIRAPKDQDKYMDLVNAVAGRMNAGVDVRVLMDRRNEKPADIDGLIALGWKPEMMRLQTSAVHNKGILVDGQIAVVGSQNWSPDGTQFNRDASLILHSAEIAQYFASVFAFDWANLVKPVSQPETAPLIAPQGAPTPSGMKRVPWNEWFQE